MAAAHRNLADPLTPIPAPPPFSLSCETFRRAAGGSPVSKKVTPRPPAGKIP